MINQIFLRNFKCFESARISLSALTVLAGVNAAGKSTVLQSLTLLHQTIAANERAHQLLLNGDCVNLGTVLETASQLYPKDELRFGLAYQDGEQSGDCEWIFVTTSRQASALPLAGAIWRPAGGEERTAHAETQAEWRFLLPPNWLDESPPLRNFAATLHNLGNYSAVRRGMRG